MNFGAKYGHRFLGALVLSWKMDNEGPKEGIFCSPFFSQGQSRLRLGSRKGEFTWSVFGGVSLREGPYFPQTIFHWS